MRYNGGIIWAAGAFVGFLFILAFMASEGALRDPLETNYDSIKNGMTLDAVENLIGSPATGDADAKVQEAEEGVPVTVVWKHGKKEVRVIFVNQKVYTKNKGGF